MRSTMGEVEHMKDQRALVSVSATVAADGGAATAPAS